ncbi:pantoate--beta-alanine ligase [Hippea maritima]|uniref:Pantothenate synthetase n=1 Tax=Hippea maritima (strain ATCC 700847 / DSM 10411 / MH2) TaxID=760142 RepID=F2LWA5_HIPMA|nr:pantoate--beta-alanine ligase [Hippea maritima]AEA34039.1 Pantothenate synthetase [Hippea maritima DSM 10411]
MRIVYSASEMQAIANKYREWGKRIGFVPTMGYLHEGHLSLVRQAKQDNDVVFVSIFVNPLQFAPNEDLDKYPRDIERDESLLNKEGVDFVFYPSVEDMYPDGFQTYVEVDKLTKVLEGKSRPTHFRGVTTVVAKLFNIAKPHRAYFGKKDAQQLIVIKRMVKDLNMDIEIIGMPIVRESDGLALSSRNKYLNQKEREQAVCLYKALMKAKELIETGQRDADVIKEEMKKVIEGYPLAKIDYIDINSLSTLEQLKQVKEGDTLVSLAVFLGSTRLIDNMWF